MKSYLYLISINKKGSFVKLTLFNEELQRTDDEFQTNLVKSSANPTFNEMFDFSIPSFEIENYSLTINVFSKKILSKTNLIGQIVFGNNELKIKESNLSYLIIFISIDNQPKHNQFVEHFSEAVNSDGDFIMKYHTLI